MATESDSHGSKFYSIRSVLQTSRLSLAIVRFGSSSVSVAIVFAIICVEYHLPVL